VHGLINFKSNEELDREEQQAADEEQQRLDLQRDTLASTLMGRFEGYRVARREIEEEWIDGLRAFNSEYNPEQLAVLKEQEARSQVYLGITKTKCMAAYARLVDLLMQTHDSFWDVAASPLADLPVEVRKQLYAQAIQELAVIPELRELDAIARSRFISERVAELKQTVIEEASESARDAALKMKRQIKDYLVDYGALGSLKKTTLEQVIYGTGCYKRATVSIRNTEKWVQGEDGEWDLEAAQEVLPEFGHVSPFELFVDPYCTDPLKVTELFRRHVMSRTEFTALKNNEMFDAEKIDQIRIESPEGHHTELDFEQTLRHMDGLESTQTASNRYDVFEYWGAVDGLELDRLGVSGVAIGQEYQANIWFCSGRVIMARLNPLKPQALPYLFVPYERAPHRFYGIGVPAMMKDSQAIMNSSMRAALDNMAITSGPIVEIDISMLPEGQTIEEAKKLHPWKVYLSDSTRGEGRMVHAQNIQTNYGQLVSLLDLARRFADEETSLPSYTHGEQGVGLNDTASGMSMLMTAANVQLKSVVKNIDDYLIQPFIKSLYDHAMRWSDAEEAKRGDFDIIAQGTTSLMAKEVLSQKIAQALQGTANPADGPLVDRRYLLEEWFRTMDIDTDKALPEINVDQLNGQIPGAGPLQANQQSGMGGIPQVPGQPQVGAPQVA
jgi:hypothetical protein